MLYNTVSMSDTEYPYEKPVFNAAMLPPVGGSVFLSHSRLSSGLRFNSGR